MWKLNKCGNMAGACILCLCISESQVLKTNASFATFLYVAVVCVLC